MKGGCRKWKQESLDHLEREGYAPTRVSLPLFDVAGVGPFDVLLCRVVYGAWPPAETLQEIERFPAPVNCRKLVHRWKAGATHPDVKVLGGLLEVYLCPKHKTELLLVLKGGAGYCPTCRLYVQADGVEPPRLDVVKPEKKVKKRGKTKPMKARRRKQPMAA